ncbi:tRNA preQ1(34) S-adenosylmethionine ribosyltransferase-isomerase QueA [Eubacteriales bacterium OttesenSCG-928-A19]|nr:tRNA preQ1(34) S-adenosylmethionine ribosyltransferase-isomerase QueA [Eubacteriales bacterium OttesenSCG-928-A19]
MRTSDFDYVLPEALIAQTPMEPRDASRLMVCDRASGKRLHRVFRDVADYLRPGDALVINDTRTIPARLLGHLEKTGGAVELLLLRRVDADTWEALVRPGKKLRPGVRCVFGEGLLRATVLEHTSAEGGRLVRFSYSGVFEEILDRLGIMPLPPYIHETLRDPSRYNTVYAAHDGSAATPTAGLHFTPALMDRIAEKGIHIVRILLHVGLGTFRPVKAENVSEHVMHAERYEVSAEAADALNESRANGGRIVCVGTTAVRTLETVTDSGGVVHPGAGETSIFITPGFAFHAADALITNFHLPQSTLLMLVSAFMGKENALDAYGEAVREGYRFFSFGDAMLITDLEEHNP